MDSQLKMRAEYADEDICRRVENFLNSRHFPAFRNLEVEVRNGLVKLAGSVNSFYEKQVALNSCKRVAGVLAIVDHLVVTDGVTSFFPNDADYGLSTRVDYVG